MIRPILVATLPGGDAHHLRDLRRAQTLEVQNDEFPVQRSQPLNQLHEAREQHAPVSVWFDSNLPDIEIIESDQRPRPLAPFVHHMGRRHVVRDAIDPCAQRALTIETIEAPPEIQVDVLEQVLALVCVELVRACEPLDCGAKCFDGLVIET